MLFCVCHASAEYVNATGNTTGTMPSPDVPLDQQAVNYTDFIYYYGLAKMIVKCPEACGKGYGVCRDLATIHRELCDEEKCDLATRLRSKVTQKLSMENDLGGLSKTATDCHETWYDSYS